MKIDSVKFRSGGLHYAGVRFAPESLRPRRPALLMLHGFPGAEKNTDLARALAARGWVCFLPHFRGSWGSSGLYSFSGILKDARIFWRRLQKDPQVNPGRMAVLGFSLGG
ncbi:MAG: alpha/beta hydrolase, partial [Elusimicrobiota bacterium]